MAAIMIMSLYASYIISLWWFANACIHQRVALYTSEFGGDMWQYLIIQSRSARDPGMPNQSCWCHSRDICTTLSLFYSIERSRWWIYEVFALSLFLPPSQPSRLPVRLQGLRQPWFSAPPYANVINIQSIWAFLMCAFYEQSWAGDLMSQLY